MPTILHDQFESQEQQDATAQLGMWTFLATEALFFGALILAFAVYRVSYGHVFLEAAKKLKLELGALNTAVLLTSSLFMALAVQAAQGGRRRKLLLCLALTAALGVAFLGIKAVEYRLDFREQVFPGRHFVWGGADPGHAEIFYYLYYVATGVHALHLTVAVGLVCWLMTRIYRRRASGAPEGVVEVVGLYWHFVDIVWVFLFPLLYLPGRS
jgi:cytochrome c oxidase subunit 3